MLRTIVAGLGLAAGLALPAAADGYQTYSVSPQTSYERGVQVTRTYPTQSACQTSCCYSACSRPTHTRTYVTKPVVTRTYTSSYTRLAPPDCYHPGTSTHDHSAHSSRSYVTSQASSGTYQQPSAYISGNSYAHDYDAAHAGDGYDSYYDGYDEVYDDGGYYEPQSYADDYGYAYNVAIHDDRDRAWAHYDHGWRR